MGRFAICRWHMAVALTLAFMAANVFFKLGSVPVNNMDEARYGVSAWEMLRNGNFLITTYAGQPEYWNLKPPLGYWLIALSFHIFGPTPFALRLPSALAAIATVAVLVLRGRHLIGRRAALIAGLMFSTGFGYLSHHGARSGDLDAMLTLLITLAAFELPHFSRSGWAILRYGLYLGMGMLLKTFAVIPMLAVGAIYLMWTGTWRSLRSFPAFMAVLALLLPTAIWAILRWQADGSPEFLQRMVQEDLIGRSTQAVDNMSGDPWSYALSIFDRFAPWPLLVLVSGFLAVSLRRQGREFPVVRTQSHDAFLLWLWALVPLVMFSLAKTHHHWYLDPTYPARAMLAAGSVLQLARFFRPHRQSLVLLTCLVVPLVANEVRIITRINRDMTGTVHYRTMTRGNMYDVMARRVQTGRLSHSQRFFLEVMQGYIVDERGAIETETVAALTN